MIYPMFIMVLLTIIVGCMTLIARVKSVKSGKVDIASYRLMNAADYPEQVVKTTRNFNNQFEMPLLFYIGCLSYMALSIESVWGLVFAWLFVAFRIAHAFVHITYNALAHRIITFWLASMMVLCLWFTLVMSIT